MYLSFPNHRSRIEHHLLRNLQYKIYVNYHTSKVHKLLNAVHVVKTLSTRNCSSDCKKKVTDWQLEVSSQIKIFNLGSCHIVVLGNKACISRFECDIIIVNLSDHSRRIIIQDAIKRGDKESKLQAPCACNQRVADQRGLGN